jgi:hypothetical protein
MAMRAALQSHLWADPASYRPITLLNCDLKIVAKVLVQRFGPAMEGVIDSKQTAFVPGRDIADNVLLHLEKIDDYLLEVGMQQGQQGCVLFLYFEKAYDRLDREWLFKCMDAMHFPESSKRWVRMLLAGTRGQIVFNGGHTSRVFPPPGTQVTMSGVKRHGSTHQKVRQEIGTT